MTGQEQIRAFVLIAVQGLCKLPDKARVDLIDSQGKMLCLVINCQTEDYALVIGKQGRNVKAIRELAWAISAKHSYKCTVIVNE